MLASRQWRLLLVLVPISFAVLWIYLASAQAKTQAATARLVDAGGDTVGRVTFTRLEGFDTRIRYSVHDLTDGFHGFHVHATGVCDASSGFASAGSHFNPTGEMHPSHDGDMPPILVQADGTGTGSFVTDRFEVDDVLGAAVIVHANPDNFANVPVGSASTQYTPNSPDATALTLATGNAGDRVACGVIRARS